MDLRALRTFLAVVDAESFSAAATRLSCTQSAVSQQIAALERDVGATLVSRRPVRPTAAGEALADDAREILTRADAATAQVLRVANAGTDRRPPRLSVTPGVEATLQGAWLPGGLASVQVDPPREAAAALRSGSVDLVVLDGVIAPGDPLPVDLPAGVTARVLMERPVELALPATHRLGERDSLDISSLGAVRWIDAPNLGGPLSTVEDAARTGLRLGLRYEGQSMTSLMALVAADAGVAMVPAGVEVPEALQHRVALVPVRRPRLTYRVEVWWHTDDRSTVVSAARWLTGQG